MGWNICNGTFNITSSSLQELTREAKVDSKEYEISLYDVRHACDDFGCEADQIVGILLELNLISIRHNEETISNFKGTDI